MCYKEIDPRVLVRCLDSACAIVLDASKTLHTLLKTGLANNYAASLAIDGGFVSLDDNYP